MLNTGENNPSLQSSDTTEAYTLWRNSNPSIDFLNRVNPSLLTSKISSESRYIASNIYELIYQNSRYQNPESPLSISEKEIILDASDQFPNFSQISEIQGELESGFLNPSEEPFCSHPKCVIKAEIICKCSNKNVPWCSYHLTEHIKRLSSLNHPTEALYLIINPKTKEMLCGILYRKNKILSDNIDDIKEQIDKLSSQLNELEAEKAGNMRILDLVESSKDIPKQNLNEFDKILASGPKEALKKFTELYENKAIYRYAKHSFLVNRSFRLIPNDSTIESNYIVFPIVNSPEIVYLNLETMDSSSSSASAEYLQDLQWFGNVYIPDHKCLFFYGGLNVKFRKSTGQTFILTNDKEIIIFPDGKPTCDLGLIYYKGFVYAIGGDDQKVAERFNFLLEQWESLRSLPEGDYRVSTSTAVKDHILFTAGYLDKVISYNIEKNYYTDIPNLKLKNDIIKLLFTWDSSVFIIELCGDIFQSKNSDLTSWKKIGRNNVMNWCIPSYVAKYRDNFYCVNWQNELIEFNMKEKSFKTKGVYNKVKNTFDIL